MLYGCVRLAGPAVQQCAGRGISSRECASEGVGSACRGGTAQRRRLHRCAGGVANEDHQLTVRGPGARISAAGADGARRRHVQDRRHKAGRLVTATLDAAPQAPVEPAAAGPASWAARAGAFLVDVFVGLAVIATAALLWKTA